MGRVLPQEDSHRDCYLPESRLGPGRSYTVRFLPAQEQFKYSTDSEEWEALFSAEGMSND